MVYDIPTDTYMYAVYIHVHTTVSGLQITLKPQGPCGPLTDQVLLAHIDILGPTFSMKLKAVTKNKN